MERLMRRGASSVNTLEHRDNDGLVHRWRKRLLMEEMGEIMKGRMDRKKTGRKGDRNEGERA
uniref:Uncharacterized protein n=1 Tax=Pristionchus pacificus TaxID=54126 RepID=A0A2A6BC46_PRIPA|eukprot:PDM63434.1 hypothetical protein PRIPAC_53791 [Pristionchus pacificus]